jgi:hypothetical protein
MPATAKVFMPRQHRKLAVVSFRDTDEFDVRISKAADALGMGKGALIRSVVHQAVDAQESRRGLQGLREQQTRMLVARLTKLWGEK